MKRLWKSFYLPLRFFIIGLSIMVMFVLGYFWPGIIFVAKLGIVTFVSIFILDIFILYRIKHGVSISRELPERFSNGDQNKVKLVCENNYPYRLFVKIIDEIPVQFQYRDNNIIAQFDKEEIKEFTFYLNPVERGKYSFGKVHVFTTSALGLFERRHSFNLEKEIAVYPSFLNLQNIELLSFAKLQHKLGLKSIRKTGNNKEFDQTRDYITGDELKHINWKATARKNKLMVNQYRDEREQDIYCLIDMGRNMKMPFKGMSLLDYSINSSLALSKVVLKNYDKIGLVTYSNKIHTIQPSDNKHNQLLKMNEALYHQTTDFKESTMEPLFAMIKRKITHRSLLIIYTNFESIHSMRRQLEVLKQLSKSHLVILISFENTELKNVLNENAGSVKDIYLKTITEKFMFEKRVLMQELLKSGIHSILSTPEGLTVDTINKYLEVKARGLL